MRGLALIVGLILVLNPFVVSAAADEDGVGGGELLPGANGRRRLEDNCGGGVHRSRYILEMFDL